MLKLMVIVFFSIGLEAAPMNFDLSVGFHLTNSLESVSKGKYATDYLTEGFIRYLFFSPFLYF